MKDLRKFYIDGQWVDPVQVSDLNVENPASEELIATISLGTSADVNKAVAAAKRAFPEFSATSVEERISLMEKLLEIYMDRYDEMAWVISAEMGAPISFATESQADCGRGHINAALEALKTFEFERQVGDTRIVKEPIGVCGFITPWNWPINQISCKVAPALATGCTMVLKPSEIAPLSGYLFTEMMDHAGIPGGVYNMINGDGPDVGSVIASHADVDMVSFTGSTRAGILVAKAAADTVKRVTQELGGKSPNIIFDDADLETAVTSGVMHMMGNTGQSCNAPSRMLVQSSVYSEALKIAEQVASSVLVDQPSKEGQHLGPLSSRVQFDKVQHLIKEGIAEGAKLVAGGSGKPEGLDTGYFVKPTVFADVNNQMAVAREEIFGPVLTMIPFDTEAQAIEIANDTPYGLAAYLSTGSEDRASRVARQLRAGMISVNSASQDYTAPFGGYKQSGNGREWGEFGFDDFLEIKG
ncbi:MAG: aldehyde dehydrogenase family protein, partial [Porticoccaceae bacterium]|nr:aldehyde dehydrogenase family protein [Porticoccaceae bacterium]